MAGKLDGLKPTEIEKLLADQIVKDMVMLFAHPFTGAPAEEAAQKDRAYEYLTAAYIAQVSWPAVRAVVEQFLRGQRLPKRAWPLANDAQRARLEPWLDGADPLSEHRELAPDQVETALAYLTAAYVGVFNWATVWSEIEVVLGARGGGTRPIWRRLSRCCRQVLRGLSGISCLSGSVSHSGGRLLSLPVAELMAIWRWRLSIRGAAIASTTPFRN